MQKLTRGLLTKDAIRDLCLSGFSGEQIAHICLFYAKLESQDAAPASPAKPAGSRKGLRRLWKLVS
jgi:hypothetical protein